MGGVTVSPEFDWPQRLLMPLRGPARRAYLYCLLVSALAQHLSITERAVEKHVSAIFTKLDLPPSQAHHRRVLAVVTYLNS